MLASLCVHSSHLAELVQNLSAARQSESQLPETHLKVLEQDSACNKAAISIQTSARNMQIFAVNVRTLPLNRALNWAVYKAMSHETLGSFPTDMRSTYERWSNLLLHCLVSFKVKTPSTLPSIFPRSKLLLHCLVSFQGQNSFYAS